MFYEPLTANFHHFPTDYSNINSKYYVQTNVIIKYNLIYKYLCFRLDRYMYINIISQTKTVATGNIYIEGTYKIDLCMHNTNHRTYVYL